MSIFVDYTDTDWGNVRINDKLQDLSRLLDEEKVVGWHEFDHTNLNKVARIDFPSKSVVVKISPRWYNTSLAREAWCYEQIRNRADLRIPALFSYSSSQNTIFPDHEILIIEYIDGRLLSPEDMSNGQIHKTIGKIYRELHKVPTYGYGWLGKDLRGSRTTWTDFLTDIDNIQPTIESGLVTRQDYEWLVDQFKEIVSDHSPCLLYGDFKPENFIILEDEIVPIDFQNCFSGHNLYDLGIILSYPQSNLLDYIPHYLNRELLPHERMTLILYVIRHSISNIGYSVTVGNFEQAKSHKRKFDEFRTIYNKLHTH